MIWAFWLFLLAFSVNCSASNTLMLHNIKVLNPRKVEMVGMADVTNYLYLNDVEDRASSCEHVHLDLNPFSGALAMHHSRDVFVAVVREIGGLELVYDSGLVPVNRDVSESIAVQEGDFILAVLPSKADKRVDSDALRRIMSWTAGRKTSIFEGWLHNMIYDLRDRITNTVIIVPIGRKSRPKASFDGYNWSRYTMSFEDYCRFVPMNGKEYTLLNYLLSSMHMIDEDDNVLLALRKPAFTPRKLSNPIKIELSPRQLLFDDMSDMFGDE